MDPWSIAVKTVGGPDSISEDFVVTVSPEDDLTCLHEQIEEYTGLSASQQRLIYRGRIIKGGESNESIKNEPKVKDVVGLADGQTIHLVPRPNSDPPQETTSPVRSENPTNSVPRSTNNSPEPASGGLLAALLGLGSADDTADEPLGQHLARLRSARIRNRNRRPNHRLTASDLEVIDPGTMEPVRQGLMTLHTMMGDRMWYRGQWIDCRDTVNQWLEATVVDIITPNDILPTHDPEADSVSTRHYRYPTSDPAVSANDLEGRMRLLLEPSDVGDGYRPRQNNEGVHLLLIHYNGWPNRWDEWIRSDSERIRPFRTRTRHPNSSTTACPTPQSHFQASPATNISSEDESTDRSFLLPELQRVFHMVQDLLDQSVGVENVELCESNERYVPWITGGIEDNAPPPLESIIEGDDTNPRIPEEAKVSSTPTVSNNEKIALKKKLQALGPLLDRLGRTLTDAAPHLAAYAESLPDETDREMQRGAPGESNVVIADDDEQEDISVHETRTEPHSTIGGLFSLLPVGSRSAQIPAAAEPDTIEEQPLDPDHVDFVNGSVNTTRGEVRSRGGRSSDDGSGLLGAYLAAASLSSLANDDDGNDDGVSGLQGLGRLLRQREANGGLGGGIDIHIHAIVTGPTVGGGMGALGGIGGLAVLGEPALPRPTLFSSTSRRIGFAEAQRLPIAVPVDEDDSGIFSELYSENPTPVDLQNGILPAETRSTDSGQHVEDMADLESIASIPPRGFETPQRQPRGGPLSRMIRRLSSRRRSSDADRSFRNLRDIA